MKMARKKARKSSSRGKAREEEAEDGEPVKSLWVETWGLAILSVVLVTVIALLSEFVSAGGSNLLGPYLGAWWATTLNRLVGGLPVIILVAAATLLGFKLVLAKGPLNYRMVLALVFLFLSTGVLLSIRFIDKPVLGDADYQISGGYLGNFLVKKGFTPVFGDGKFGPYLITALGIFFTLIWGFRLSMVAVSEKTADSMVVVLRPFFRVFTRLWSRPAPVGVPDGLDGLALMPPGSAPGAAGGKGRARTVSQGAARPDGTVLPAARRRTGPDPDAATSNAEPDARKAAGLRREELRREMASGAGTENGNETDELPEDLDDLDLNDPLTVRRLRDLDLERKRVSELNEWEVKTRDPEIAGLLQKEKARLAGEKLPPMAPAGPDEAAMAGDGEDADSEGKPRKRGRRKAASEAPRPESPEVGLDAEEGGWSGGQPEAGNEAGDDSAEGPYGGLGLEEGAEGETPAAMARRAAPRPKPPQPEVVYDPYRVPTLDEIFDEPPKQPLEFTEEELREQSKLLEDQLINFKVMGKVTQICPGPVITRYEVELAPGVKVSRIATLADDLALALRAKSIRILAPIPGKSVVGIEVPNRKAQIVYIKEILKAPEFNAEEDSLKICLGKTIAGEPYVMDLARAPHLLIAGQTGSGKSVCINSIMASFLCSKSPDDLRMILVDPKVVELKPYDSIPHLLYPVITQPDVAVAGLKWATVEMDRRYEVLAQCGVRNIKGFNAKFKDGKLPEEMDEEDRKKMSYIVIIIDELADLMMVAGKEVETNIARIAQKARAVGIHLILATQRPSTNVITGTIKANLPTRIAFQVASQIDARTIMDKMGAEKLLGRGDMLFRPIEFPEPVRLHGCYLDDAQAEKLAGAAADQHVNYPQIQSFSLEDDPSAEGADDEPRDEKFREAAELVVQVKQASVSLLQRRLGIGYARSGRLVDQLERAGVVGKERGSKPREVLMDADELQSFLSSGLNDD